MNRAALGSAVAALALAWTLPALAADAVVPDVSVTIYNNDLALIEDVRRLDLPKGQFTQEFPGVSAEIQPATVTIAAPGAGVIEQNFDYDLLSPERLVDKAVGQTVTLVRTNPTTGAETTEPAKILANNNGTLLRLKDQIAVLGQIPNARIVFADLPAALKVSPTLSVALQSDRAGVRPVTLRYLTKGFTWGADYVALYQPSAGTIDLQGWITLHNTSGTTFDQARVLLVAGGINSSGRGVHPDDAVADASTDDTDARPGTESAPRERLGDFYLYPLASRTTLADQQQKQVGFLETHGTPATHIYTFRNDWLQSQENPVSAKAQLRFSTSAKGGLGDALPAGTVRIYQRDARGEAQFIGESAIGHIPMGSQLELTTGDAFDVKVQTTVVSRKQLRGDDFVALAKWRVSDGKTTHDYTVSEATKFWQSEVTYHLTNASPQAAVVELTQSGLGGGWRDTRVPKESLPGRQINDDQRRWNVTVPANGEVTLSVTYATSY